MKKNNTINEFSNKWQNMQKESWKNNKGEIVDFFNKYVQDVSELYDFLICLDYKKQQRIFYLLSKIRKVIKICDFLDSLKKEKNEDVDKIKIFLLISHAEITINTFYQKDVNNNSSHRELVKKFFAPIVDRYGLDYKVRITIDDINKIKDATFSSIFYDIRCEYVHKGNYTGIIFKNEKSEDCAYNFFFFEKKSQTINGECKLTYKEFINIYLDALVENIKIFSNYNELSKKV
ncbi:MAG: hypothetical protein KAI71_01600 [Candidatus Pacebacteria bacterium]|nr:hypothetical protein [Candidatus Paceibacterota bacterium]